MTIRAWASEWLETDCVRWKPRTVRTYRSVLRMYVLPALGDQALDAVTRRELRAWLLALRTRGLAPGTIRLALATVRALYAAAVDAELVPVNPATQLGRVVAMRRDAQRVDIPTASEVARILAVAETHEPRLFPLLLLLARTGLRVGEACGLRWRDVELDRRLLHVERTVGDGGAENSPKSGLARDVDLSQQVVAVLRPLQGAPDAWVFARPTGVHADQREVNAALRTCARVAGVERYITAHGLRHAYASTLVSQGVPLEYIARQLGHATTVLLSTCYGRHLPAHHPELVDTLDAVG